MSKRCQEMLMIARNENRMSSTDARKTDFGLLSELVIEELQTKAQEKYRDHSCKSRMTYFMNGDQTLILCMMINLIIQRINYGKIKDISMLS